MTDGRRIGADRFYGVTIQTLQTGMEHLCAAHNRAMLRVWTTLPANGPLPLCEACIAKFRENTDMR